jgi:outer membrane receptor protein involved in Fe transport
VNLRYRYLADRAANEANTIQAEGYFLTDLVMTYHLPAWTLGLSIENLFNQEWKEAQFETESRLLEEVDPVSEIHFTPGSPLFVKGSLSYRF